MKIKKKKNKIIIPLYTTHPITNGEEGNKKTEEEAIEMARKWVEEHKM